MVVTLFFWGGDQSSGFGMGKVILEGGFVGERVSLDGGIVQDHGVEEELAVGTVGELHGLVDDVFNGPGGKGRVAVNEEVDWDRD